MRIAIFSDNFYPEISGLSDSVIALAKELSKNGHFVNFYVPKYSPKDYEKVKLPPREINLGEKINIIRFSSISVGASTGQGRMVVPTPWRWHEVGKFKPDIIHTQLFFGVGLEALIASRKLHVPLVGTNHTAIKEFLRYSPLRSEKIDGWILKYVNWYYGKCVFVTAPSQSVGDEMKMFGFKKPCHVISNPVDIKTFSPLSPEEKKSAAEKFGFGEFTIIHAGRLAAERKIDVILKAIAIVKKEIPKIELAVAGNGAAEKDLRELARSLGIESSVKFLGFLDKPALAEAYNASKVFVITSTADTQSMVMMQAMACGLPVIGVRARALPEYINQENGILIEPGDCEMLAKKIIFLLKNSEMGRKLGDGGRIFAQKFSAPEIAKEWERIYERVIKSYNHSR